MKQNKEVLKSYFETGDQPTQEQYYNTWDSFWHKDEIIPSENIEQLPSSKSIITSSGRITLRSSLNWVTNADDNYGTNLFNASDDCGAGSNPEYKLIQLGHVIPMGHKINLVTVVGRTSDMIVEDIRFQFVKRIKNTLGDWHDITSDSEFDNTVLYDNLWMANTEQVQYTSASSQKARRVFEMETTTNNNVFEEDGEFFMYLKPQGILSTDKYFHYTISIETESI